VTGVTKAQTPKRLAHVYASPQVGNHVKGMPPLDQKNKAIQTIQMFVRDAGASLALLLQQTAPGSLLLDDLGRVRSLSLGDHAHRRSFSQTPLLSIHWTLVE
jgi:hypothetical protein